MAKGINFNVKLAVVGKALCVNNRWPSVDGVKEKSLIYCFFWAKIWAMCEWEKDKVYNIMCELGKFNIEKYQHVIVFLYLCKVLSFKVP